MSVYNVYTSWYTQEFALAHVCSARYTSDIIQRVSKTTGARFGEYSTFLLALPIYILFPYYLSFTTFRATSPKASNICTYFPSIYWIFLFLSPPPYWEIVYRFCLKRIKMGEIFGDDDIETHIFLKTYCSFEK